ncbi:MAG: NYN domain-containing protein, partial [Candidatus Omnitrophica bacterium]|nr:NYN domain-containing protein [Candidatus Omnitrophota bacterium]
EVLYTTHDKDADSVIVDLLRKASSKDKISVSSDDNFVRNHARVYGSDILSIKELEDIIMLKQKSARSKIREKEVEGAKEINEELKKHWGLK